LEKEEQQRIQREEKEKLRKEQEKLEKEKQLRKQQQQEILRKEKQQQQIQKHNTTLYRTQTGTSYANRMAHGCFTSCSFQKGLRSGESYNPHQTVLEKASQDEVATKSIENKTNNATAINKAEKHMLTGKKENSVPYLNDFSENVIIHEILENTDALKKSYISVLPENIVYLEFCRTEIESYDTEIHSAPTTNGEIVVKVFIHKTDKCCENFLIKIYNGDNFFFFFNVAKYFTSEIYNVYEARLSQPFPKGFDVFIHNFLDYNSVSKVYTGKGLFEMTKIMIDFKYSHTENLSFYNEEQNEKNLYINHVVRFANKSYCGLAFKVIIVNGQKMLFRNNFGFYELESYEDNSPLYKFLFKKKFCLRLIFTNDDYYQIQNVYYQRQINNFCVQCFQYTEYMKEYYFDSGSLNIAYYNNVSGTPTVSSHVHQSALLYTPNQQYNSEQPENNNTIQESRQQDSSSVTYANDINRHIYPITNPMMHQNTHETPLYMQNVTQNPQYVHTQSGLFMPNLPVYLFDYGQPVFAPNGNFNISQQPQEY
ncbi:hypothetical protein EDEG_01483, partial [Edhazardia aedis USNM 41457]